MPKGKGGCAGLVYQAVVDGLNKPIEWENAEEKKSQSAAIKMTCSTDGGYIIRFPYDWGCTHEPTLDCQTCLRVYL